MYNSITFKFLLAAAGLRTISAAAVTSVSNNPPHILDEMKEAKMFVIWPVEPPSTEMLDTSILNINSTCDLLPMPEEVCRKTDTLLKELLAPTDCGDGTFCTMGTCGRWGGKDSMCCGGIMFSHFDDMMTQFDNLGLDPSQKGSSKMNFEMILSSVRSIKNACKPFQDVLSQRDIPKSREPTHEGCDEFKLDGTFPKSPKTYPINASAMDPQGIVESCCRLDEDSVTISKNQLLTKIEKAVCMPRSVLRDFESKKAENGKDGSDSKTASVTSSHISPSSATSSPAPSIEVIGVSAGNSIAMKPGMMITALISIALLGTL